MPATTTHVIFAHGLWLTGAESLFLRRRLQRDHGFDCHAFRYPTVSGSMKDIVERLERFVAEVAAQHRVKTLHFVGHSLGCLVLHRYFERNARELPGRVVFLGPPAVRSKAAQSVAQIAWAAPLIGRPVAEELFVERDEPRKWADQHQLGIIAGSRPMGLGRFFAKFDEESDGTVAVSETELPGATDHVVMPVSHMGMLLSARVAQQVGAFLVRGAFSLR
jgi:pimeloyl-ACP methyl ester carboxylesterase